VITKLLILEISQNSSTSYLSFGENSIINNDEETSKLPTCFMCGKLLKGDSNSINNHIDNCLSNGNEFFPSRSTKTKVLIKRKKR
jgi:hypothetical protein